MNNKSFEFNWGHYPFPIQAGNNLVFNNRNNFIDQNYYNNYNFDFDYNSTEKKSLSTSNPEAFNFTIPNQNIINILPPSTAANSSRTNMDENNNKNFYFYDISEINNMIWMTNENIIPTETDINKMPCGIINYGNNCYLNSGLQILSSCNKFLEELNKYKNIKSGLIGLLVDAFYKILRNDIYNPMKLFSFFCKINNEDLRAQFCSQTFIRKLLKNLNDELLKYGNIQYITQYKQYNPNNQIEFESYNKFIKANKYFPESFALSLFTAVTKSHSYGICKFCHQENEDFSFTYFIDQILYLDNIPKKCNFSEVLINNIGKLNNLTMNCKKCQREIIIKDDTKYIKIPDIFIFTLERYKENMNNVEIIPDESIDMGIFLDKSIHLSNTRYELFAINIRYGSTRDFGHEICQIKRNLGWYEINDTKSYKRTEERNRNSYGLFYRKLLT